MANDPGPSNLQKAPAVSPRVSRVSHLCARPSGRMSFEDLLPSGRMGLQVVGEEEVPLLHPPAVGRRSRPRAEVRRRRAGEAVTGREKEKVRPEHAFEEQRKK